jgi:hypothetical protein
MFTLFDAAVCPRNLYWELGRWSKSKRIVLMFDASRKRVLDLCVTLRRHLQAVGYEAWITVSATELSKEVFAATLRNTVLHIWNLISVILVQRHCWLLDRLIYLLILGQTFTLLTLLHYLISYSCTQKEGSCHRGAKAVGQSVRNFSFFQDFIRSTKAVTFHGFCSSSMKVVLRFWNNLCELINFCTVSYK